MLINAAPRSYTSNIVADADLNLEGYNVTANALYSKDNYLLTMLDYGEAFPTDVKEGDKLFAWGEDSTKSYIYTYKQGAWDAGVKPQHMQDYYIADEQRTVRFCFLKGGADAIYSMFYGSGSTSLVSVNHQLLTFEPNVFILGSFDIRLYFDSWGSSSVASFTYPSGLVLFSFTDCTTNQRGSYQVDFGGISISAGTFEVISVVVPSGVNAFTGYLNLPAFSLTSTSSLNVGLSYQFDI